ncbi:MAG: hypothetical protein PUI53_11170 [Butyricicoccus porcorum]|nr:hypothetical protein [Butyricicoccus porcorum]
MDDLDLEKLKQELDDVSGGSRYDVEDIMREAGASEPEQDKESLEQLMQRFGIRVDEPQPAAPVQTKATGHAAPVTEDEMPKLPETEDLSALFRAAEQTQDVIDQQNELAADAQGEPEQPDPLEEQEDVFARLFNQLGQIEQDPVDMVFSKPEGHTQTEFIDPRTEMLEEPEEEPDLMARLFDNPPVSQTEPDEAPSYESETTEPEEEQTVHIDAESTVHWEMPETIANDAELFTSAVGRTQVLEDVEPEPVEEAEPDEEPEEKPEKKGFWSKWFGADDEDDETDADEDAEEQPSDAEPTEVFEPVDEQETQVLEDVEPEPVEEAQPDEQPEAPKTEPEEKPEKKGFWSKWFGADDDDADDEDDETDADEGAEEQPSDAEPTEVFEPVDEQATQVLEDVAPEPVEEAEPDEQPETPKTEPEDAETVELPEEEAAPDNWKAEEPENITAPEEVYFEPEPDEIEDEPQQEPQEEPEDAGVAAFAEAMAQEEAVGATEETPEPPRRPQPEDIPVISEEELAEFLSGVEQEPEEPITSFEQILREGGMPPEPSESKPQKLSLEEFPEEETTVYVDIPVRGKREPQAHEPELFDAEAELETKATDTEAKTEKPASAAKAAVKPASKVKKRPKPEPDPEWLGLPLEELCKTAPALEELRREGPVMQREVARQREWIMERHRAYMEARHPAPKQEEPEEEEAPEDTEPSAIDAAGELRALLEQEQSEEGSGAVFNDGSDGTPETEPADREEERTEPEETAEPEPVEQPQEPLPEIPDMPEQAEPAEQPEPQVRRKAAQVSASRKPANKRAVWPKEEVPRDLRKAAGSWKQRARVQAQRSIVVAVLTVIAVYLSCAADFSLPLPASMDYVDSPRVVLISLIVLQLVAMVAAFDVIKDGILSVVHLSPNFSTLVDLALVLNLVHCIVRLIWDGEEMPYTCAAMLALFAQMRARVSDARTRHYVYKVAVSTPQPVGIYCRDGDLKHIVKTRMADTAPFVRQTVQPDRGRQLESILMVLAVVISIVLSGIVCVSTGDAGRLIYVLAATMTGACQVALLSAVSMGRCNAARHMMKGGTALDGMRGASALSAAEAVVLTDDDLFPAGSVALERLELRSQLNDATALAYAAALAGDSSLGHMLAEEVRARYGAPLVAHHVVRYTGGGISGQIGGLEILLGGVDFMAERGILAGEVPENGLVLAVEGEVAAVLAVDYQVPAVLFNAMQVLTERHIRILLHTRNHQVTPQLVERLYGLHEGTVLLPELETDRALRSPRYVAGGTLCGIMLRDGLVPFADCVSTAQGQNRLSAVGAVIGIGAALICMLLMAYLCYVFVPTDARPIRVLLYTILCFVPIFFLESGVGRD